MGKSQDTKKEKKKPASKTPAEKKLEKREKEEISCRSLPKEHFGSGSIQLRASCPKPVAMGRRRRAYCLRPRWRTASRRCSI